MSKSEPKITRRYLQNEIDWLEDTLTVAIMIINHLCDAHHNPRAVTPIVPNMQRELRALMASRPEMIVKDTDDDIAAGDQPWHFQEEA
jgi:hypothetical protein